MNLNSFGQVFVPRILSLAKINCLQWLTDWRMLCRFSSSFAFHVKLYCGRVIDKYLRRAAKRINFKILCLSADFMNTSLRLKIIGMQRYFWKFENAYENRFHTFFIDRVNMLKEMVNPYLKGLNAGNFSR